MFHALRRPRLSLSVAALGLALASCSLGETRPAGVRQLPSGVLQQSSEFIERSTSVMTDAQLRDFRVAYQAGAVARFSAARSLASGAAPSCTTGVAVLAYVEALIVNNRFAEAGAFATSCAAGTSVEHKLALARAARVLRDFPGELRYVAEAAAAATSADAKQLVALEQAESLRFAYESLHTADIVAAITAGFPDAADRATVLPLVDRSTNSKLTPALEADVLALADRSTPAVAALLLRELGHIMVHSEFRYHDAFQIYASARGATVMANLPTTSIHRYVRSVHQAMMNHRNNEFGYAQAEVLQLGTIAYQRKDITPFNDAFGPYTRKDIAAHVCADTYEAGPHLAELKDQYLAGTLTPSAGIAAVDQLRAAGPHKFNTELFRGTLYESMGDFDGAMSAYWEARQLCPFSGRAVGASLGTINELNAQARSDHFVPTLPSTLPAALSKYAINDAMLSDRQRKALAFGVQFWWPYLGMLSDAGQGVYVAPTFMGSMETPIFSEYGYDDYRYPDDGRLIDDIDGLGGTSILIGFTSLMDYKQSVVVHEAGHQFHFLAGSVVTNCISDMFLNAQLRDVFWSGYAATNEYEYFAVSVQNYTDPIGPQQREWLQANDPNMFRFLQSIEASNGDLSKISCAEVQPTDAGAAVDAGADASIPVTAADAGAMVADPMAGGSVGGSTACSTAPSRSGTGAWACVAAVMALVGAARRRKA